MEEDFVWLTVLRDPVHHGGKAWRQELEVAAHIHLKPGSRVTDTDVQVAFSFVFGHVL